MTPYAPRAVAPPQSDCARLGCELARTGGDPCAERCRLEAWFESEAATSSSSPPTDRPPEPA